MGPQAGQMISRDVFEPSDVFGLRDACVVVTGGAQGIGRGICELFRGIGARVAALDLDGDGAGAAGDVGFACDVRDAGAVARGVEQIERELGPVRVWVNNAGGGLAGSTVSTLDVPRESWDRVFELNLTAVMHCAQIAATRMIAAGQGGSIVNVASFQGTNASPHMAAYGAAKAGVIHLTKTLALELAPHGIRVNAVAPSFVLTPAAEREMSAERREVSINAIPLHRAGRPADIAGVVLALAGDLGAFVTGQVIVADGGLGLTNARPHRGVLS